MKALKRLAAVPLLLLVLTSCRSVSEYMTVKAAREVIERSFGPVENVRLKCIEASGECDSYEINASGARMPCAASARCAAS